MLKELNHYLADMAVLNIKLHNLHWNVVGIHFKPLHDFTEELYDKVFEDFDEVAEMIKIRGLRPAASLKEYVALSCIEELPNDVDFSAKQVLEILQKDLSKMKEQATDLRNLADEKGDFTAVAFFEDQVSDFAKNLWFLEAMTV